MSCPIIEIAEDHQTAKKVFGIVRVPTIKWRAVAPVARWTWGYFAVDFTYEDDEWKIFNLMYVNDIDCICGQSWGKEKKSLVHRFRNSQELADFKYPEYSVKKTIRPLYAPDRALTKHRKFRFRTGHLQKHFLMVSDKQREAREMANSRQYTDEELIQRVWDVEEIKKLIHKRVIYIANEMRKEELNDLWVQNPESQEDSFLWTKYRLLFTGMDAHS